MRISSATIVSAVQDYRELCGRGQDPAKQAQRAQVATHSTDMGPAYLAACRRLLPNSQSVIDRFHVAKKLGEVTDGLRKKTIELTNEACPAPNASACVP